MRKWNGVVLFLMVAWGVMPTTAFAQEKYDREKAKKYAAQLKDKDADVRGKAAIALGAMKAKEYAKEVAALLKDKEWSVRRTAAFVLGRMKAKEYAKEVAALLKDKEAEVRVFAAMVLGAMEQAEYKEEAAQVVEENMEQFNLLLYDEDFRAFAEPALRWLGYTVKKTEDGQWKIEKEK